MNDPHIEAFRRILWALWSESRGSPDVARALAAILPETKPNENDPLRRKLASLRRRVLGAWPEIVPADVKLTLKQIRKACEEPNDR